LAFPPTANAAARPVNDPAKRRHKDRRGDRLLNHAVGMATVRRKGTAKLGHCAQTKQSLAIFASIARWTDVRAYKILYLTEPRHMARHLLLTRRIQ
jgi:hypothetical protein